MKVLHVIPSYEPAWSFGGTVTATSELCKSLAGKGVDITVYATDADGRGGHLDVPLNEPLDLEGVKTWYFHCDFGAKDAFYSRDLAKKLKETTKDFDLVHVSAIWQWIQMDVYRCCRRNNIPYVVSAHSSLMKWSFEEVGNRMLKRIYWNLFGARTIKSSTAVHFSCEGEREVSKSYPLPASFLVPNSINYRDFTRDEGIRKKLRKKFDIPEGKTVLLFLGRIHPKKNIELVLKAIEKNKSSDKDIVFFIVGPVEDKNYYNRLQNFIDKLKLHPKVRWLPPVGYDTVKELYFIADLMVLPSKMEGVSMAVIEALASSLPVLISNRVANYREIEADGVGVVVEPTEDSISRALKTVLNGRRRLEEMSRNARATVANRYDSDKISSLMLRAYEDLLGATRSRELKWQ